MASSPSADAPPGAAAPAVSPEPTDAFRTLSAQLLGRVLEAGPRTITELSDGLAASRPTVRRALDVLEDRALVRRAGLRVSDAGRPAIQYERGPGVACLYGIDVRAYSTHVTCASTTGRVLGRRDIPHAHVDEEGRLHALLDAVEELSSEVGDGRTPEVVVLGVPGIIGPEGRVILSRIIPGWTGLDLRTAVTDRFPVAQVRVENDMNLRAMAEVHGGSARGLEDVVYLTDHGHLRPAVVIGGRVRPGAHHVLGEDNSLSHVGLVPRTLRHQGRAVEFRRIALGLEDGTLEPSWLPVLQDALVDVLLTVRYLVDPQAFIIDGPPATTGPEQLRALRERLAARITIAEAPLILPVQHREDVALHGALTLALRDALTTMLEVLDPPIPSIFHDQPTRSDS
jgi:predicted NBD/HSP70 family sugar kinase